MFKYNCAKRTKYYDDVIRLHTQEGMGQKRISKIIPVSESTIKRRIRNFVRETKVKEVVMKEQVQDSVTLHGSQRDTDVKALQAEIARLKKELAHESLKSAAFNEIINVAEKQFNISIRKKLAPDSKEPACSRPEALSGGGSLHAVWCDEAGLLQVRRKPCTPASCPGEVRCFVHNRDT